jgi:acetyl-CoA carboxylase biotin carboxylase subunit
VRWDGGIEAGNEVTRFYDPLLGKLVVWAETRERAIARMRRALSELVVVGVPTSQPFHLRVMDDAEFGSGTYDITYLDRRAGELLAAVPDRELEAAAVAVALAEDALKGVGTSFPAESPQRPQGDWARAARLDGLR